MGYDQYRDWLKGMKPSDLNKEIVKLQTNARGAVDLKAKEAWGRMLDLALQEQRRQDEGGALHV